MSVNCEATIRSIAERQHGLVTRAHLLKAGLTTVRIDSCVRSGRLRVLHRGVYLADAAPSPYAPEMAALMVAGPASKLSHETAASLWKIRPPLPESAPTEVLRLGAAGRSRPGVRIHGTSRLEADEATELNILPITTPARTILDLSTVLSGGELERAVATAERLNLLTLAELKRLVRRYPRRPGAARLRRIIEAGEEEGLTMSKPEDAFRELLKRAKISGASYNALVQGAKRYIVDVLFRGLKVIVEVDGFAFHSSHDSFEADHGRDSDLASRGYRVLRFTARQIRYQPELVLAKLVQMLTIVNPDLTDQQRHR